MINIKAEIDYRGFGDRVEQIGRIKIVNTLENALRPQLGDYRVTIDGQEFTVKDHVREDSFWHIVLNALQQWEDKN